MHRKPQFNILSYCSRPCAKCISQKKKKKKTLHKICHLFSDARIKYLSPDLPSDIDTELFLKQADFIQQQASSSKYIKKLKEVQCSLRLFFFYSCGFYGNAIYYSLNGFPTSRKISNNNNRYARAIVILEGRHNEWLPESLAQQLDV